MATNLNFVYVTYINGAAENIWRAITDPQVTYKYWGHNNVSDWKVGSKWEHQRPDETREVDVSETMGHAELGFRLGRK